MGTSIATARKSTPKRKPKPKLKLADSAKKQPKKQPKKRYAEAMRCADPRCRGRAGSVYGREHRDGTIRRRRRCPTCGETFDTIEQAMPDWLKRLSGAEKLAELDAKCRTCHRIRNNLRQLIATIDE